MYGPTEATVYVTFGMAGRPQVAGAGRSVIGRPLPGACVFVLDRWLCPVPAGVTGELYVAGRGAGPGVSRASGA